MKLLLAAVAACVLGLPGPAATAATPAQAIAKLNAQRRASGIPAGIVEQPAWSRACHLHNRYERGNDTLTHPEDTSRPGYTTQGNWAGTHAVLARGSNWNDGNPFEFAPIHLTQLLGPALSRTGVDDWHDWVCATTFPGYLRPPPATNSVLTYPGDGRSIYLSMVASELPFVPGEFVGLPKGTRTGPYLYVYVWGPWASEFGKVRVVAASLTGPEGAVALKHVDNTTPTLGPFLPQGSGMLIPVQPLRPNATYRATVTMSDGSGRLTYRWRFTTSATPPEQPGTGKRNEISYRYVLSGGQLQVFVRSTAPNPVVTLQPPGGQAREVPLTRVGAVYRSPPVGFVPGATLCVRSGGVDIGYALVNVCKALRQ